MCDALLVHTRLKVKWMMGVNVAIPWPAVCAGFDAVVLKRNLKISNASSQVVQISITCYLTCENIQNC